MNLPALQNSPFLQSLGWAIANSLWQAAALWVAYILISGIYRGASAQFKNNLSTILLSSAFIWFCITLFNKYFAIHQSDNYIQFYSGNNISAATAYNWSDIVINITAILPYLSVAYLLLLIFLSIRLINVYRYTRFIKFNGLQKPGVEWKLFTEKVARQIGITKNIRLWISHNIDVPATIGFLKPIILIPLASINQLSPDQMEAIILHELSHIKRNDYLINLFISIIETILFFNPFVVVLAKIIKRERENCCDDFVIQYQYDRHTYASALLSLEQYRNTNFRLAMGATSGKKQLLHRVKRIMEVNNTTNFNYGQKLIALLFITGIICSVAWLSPQSYETQKKITTSDDKVYENIINKRNNPEPFLVKQNDDHIISLPSKPKLKKALISTTPQLKVMTEIKLEKTVTDHEQKSSPSFKSNQQRFHSFQDYFDERKLLASKGAQASLFNKAKEIVLIKTTSGNTVKSNREAYFELIKMQSELDRIQFSFSFDMDKLDEVVEETLTSKEQQQLYLNQNIKQTDIKKMISIELKKLQNKKFNAFKSIKPLPNTTASLKGMNSLISDSLIIAEINSSNNRSVKIINRINRTISATGLRKATVSKSPAEVYTYDYNTASDYEHNYPSPSSTNKQSNANRKQPSVITVKPGFIYRTVPHENLPPKSVAPKPHTPYGDNLRIEYKKGVIVINGEKIDLPNVKELLAHLPSKNKKLTTTGKDVDIQINF